MDSVFPSKEGHDTVLEYITWQNIKIRRISHTLMLNYPAERHFITKQENWLIVSWGLINSIFCSYKAKK